MTSAPAEADSSSRNATGNKIVEDRVSRRKIMAEKKPNILILWGDDIGWWNIRYNNRGQMAACSRQHSLSRRKVLCREISSID